MRVAPGHSPILHGKILYGCSHRVAGVSIELLNPAALVILYLQDPDHKDYSALVIVILVISHNHHTR